MPSTGNRVVYEPKVCSTTSYRWGLQFKSHPNRGNWFTLERRYKYLWRARFEAWFLTNGTYRYRVIDCQ